MSRHNVGWLGFAIGVVGAALIISVPPLRELVTDVERSGYVAAFVSGILYGLSLTSPLASVIFAQLPESLNPLAVTLIGGMGAALYDLLAFTVFRQSIHWHFIQALVERMPHREHLPRWMRYGLGILIVASPLPDELAAGWFGFSDVTPARFLGLSFLANAFGILVIISIF
ncbi:MAG: hypothetical protein HYY50_04795 [Candidatus Kerfeldbacteria bacterium]|nr:hypothetical protein [Candidatus Kerfeldbacteria bacterium]